MIITLKNLQQQTFTIEFESGKTVLELKKRIYEDRGAEYTVERQKLIYAGVILEDERTIASYNVDAKKFLVVMLKRDVGGIAQKKDTSNRNLSTIAATSSTSRTISEGAKEESKQSIGPTTQGEENPVDTTQEQGNVINAPTNPSGEDGQSRQAESNLLMGEEYNHTVDSIVEMGYTREMVERAMAASFNNPERAVEYLISGIPETEDEILVSSNQSHSSGGSSSDRPRQQTVSRNDPFEFLRNQPQFLQMRSLIYQNPDLLQAVLQQIGQTNPALLRLISENQDAFLNMLNEPLGDDSNMEEHGIREQLAAAARAVGDRSHATGGANNTISAQTTNNRATAAAAVAALEAAAAAANTGVRDTSVEAGDQDSRAENLGGVMALTLTSQDRDAIERLKGLGFPEAIVLQAYFACEKDEQLAANFLISSAFDD